MFCIDAYHVFLGLLGTKAWDMGSEDMKKVNLEGGSSIYLCVRKEISVCSLSILVRIMVLTSVSRG